jgi:hypothetical protein
MRWPALYVRPVARQQALSSYCCYYYYYYYLSVFPPIVLFSLPSVLYQRKAGNLFFPKVLNILNHYDMCI